MSVGTTDSYIFLALNGFITSTSTYTFYPINTDLGNDKQSGHDDLLHK